MVQGKRGETHFPEGNSGGYGGVNGALMGYGDRVTGTGSWGLR
jgi:hypothetical protein